MLTYLIREKICHYLFETQYYDDLTFVELEGQLDNVNTINETGFYIRSYCLKFKFKINNAFQDGCITEEQLDELMLLVSI